MKNQHTQKAQKTTAQYHYLDALKASGICNMFAAPHYLATEFNLSNTKAFQIFANWTHQPCNLK